MVGKLAGLQTERAGMAVSAELAAQDELVAGLSRLSPNRVVLRMLHAAESEVLSGRVCLRVVVPGPELAQSGL